MDKFETIIISTKERIIILHLRVSKFLYTLKSVWITMSHLNLKKIRFALIVYYRKKEKLFIPRGSKNCVNLRWLPNNQLPNSSFKFTSTVDVAALKGGEKRHLTFRDALNLSIKGDFSSPRRRATSSQTTESKKRSG